ncbi:MAG: BRO family protein [Candidatus Paceibacterota bacterium]|jgi:DNA-damage-inducible protein D
MDNELIINGPNKDFEKIKEVDENGIEFWRARNLFPLLGYSRWETFDDVVARAAKSALNSGQIVANHFRHLTKLVEIGSGVRRAIKDWKLDRYACYLVAQNGDSKIPQIAQAQTYFAVQTRRQEIFDQLPEAEKRLFIRGKLWLKTKSYLKPLGGQASPASDFLTMPDTEVFMVPLYRILK